MTFSDDVEISMDAIMNIVEAAILVGDKMPHRYANGLRMLLESLVSEVIKECS